MGIAAALIMAAAIPSAPAEQQRVSIVAGATAQVEILRMERVSLTAPGDEDDRRSPTVPRPRMVTDGRILIEFS